MKKLVILFTVICSSYPSYATSSRLSSLILKKQSYFLTPYSKRLLHGSSVLCTQQKSHLLEQDWQKMQDILDEKLDEKVKTILQHLPHNYNIKLAYQEITEELKAQGYSEQEAFEKIKIIDEKIDTKRERINLPFKVGLIMTSLAIPATWAVVYNKDFYTRILEKWPWLAETSWDWSEPLVQSTLTTETGIALFAGCLTAVGYRPYQRWCNKQLAKDVEKQLGISKPLAQRFIALDTSQKKFTPPQD